MRTVELLAPAGDLEKLKVALHYGADAVYIGGKDYSLRARASNFDLEMIQEAVEYAHAHDKKVYVTTNIIPQPGDLEGFIEYVKTLEGFGVDALICASAAMVSLVKAHTTLDVHLSTQQSVLNSGAVSFWADHGVSRVVLAREVTLEELEALMPHTPIEVEVFIHGGMCVSYSGKCTLSNTMSLRDANRGGCAHSCRWNYELYQGDQKHSQKSPFSMASKDLQAVQYIPRLIDLGVASLKIEGRMKSIHYIATVVKTYRTIIDAYLKDGMIDTDAHVTAIKKAENRLTSHGFMAGMTTVNEQLYNMRSEQPTQAFVALVLDYDTTTGRALIEQRNHFTVGDTLEVLSPHTGTITFSVTALEDEETKESITVARHPKARMWIPVPIALKPYDMLRKASEQ